MKLHKGDTVIITGGKDKGRKGKIEKIFPDIASVLVPGINMYKRHMKKRDQEHPGGIIDKSRPIPVAMVALICPKCNQATRVGYLVNKDEKIRICRKCEQSL
jgi:large subunit ribosomal protein L24